MAYKFRVILDVEDDVFRDIIVNETITLEDLHFTIAKSFGFKGQEMASFYRSDDNWEQGEEIPLFDLSDDGSARLMNETRINDVAHEVSPKLIYIYDFLSMWTFFIELADIVEKEDGRQYPNVLFSFGELPDSPPEKKFESDPSFDFDEPLDNYDDLDFDENWN